MVMEPGEERAFQLIFQPQRPGITKESLVIESNSISSPDRFEIRGIAGESPDPVASLVLERKAFEGGRIRAKAKLSRNISRRTLKKRVNPTEKVRGMWVTWKPATKPATKLFVPAKSYVPTFRK